MNAVAESIYQSLLATPGDAPTMCVLADALEDEGESTLADAYRWAAREGRWPFARTERKSGQEVYDWDSVGREFGPYTQSLVPDAARLPKPLYDAIRKLPDRKYGDVNDAFVLLSRTLPLLAVGDPS